MQYMVFGGLPSTDAAEPVLRNCAGSINTKPEPANWAAAVVVLDACKALWVLRTAHCNELGVVLLSRVPRIEGFNYLNETILFLLYKLMAVIRLKCNTSVDCYIIFPTVKDKVVKIEVIKKLLNQSFEPKHWCSY